MSLKCEGSKVLNKTADDPNLGFYVGCGTSLKLFECLSLSQGELGEFESQDTRDFFPEVLASTRYGFANNFRLVAKIDNFDT